MSGDDSQEKAQGCCGCLLLIAFGPTFLVFLLYLFSNGTTGATKDVEIQDLTYAYIAPFVPPGTERDSSFYDTLKENPKVTDLEIDSFSLKAALGEQAGIGRMAGRILGTMSGEIRELDGYLDIVRLSFSFEKKARVSIDFLVLEGMFWGTLKSWVTDNDDSWMVIRPWAQCLDVIDVKTE